MLYSFSHVEKLKRIELRLNMGIPQEGLHCIVAFFLVYTFRNLQF